MCFPWILIICTLIHSFCLHGAWIVMQIDSTFSFFNLADDRDGWESDDWETFWKTRLWFQIPSDWECNWEDAGAGSPRYELKGLQSQQFHWDLRRISSLWIISLPHIWITETMIKPNCKWCLKSCYQTRRWKLYLRQATRRISGQDLQYSSHCQ